jgi:hypothetical protein
MEECRWLHEISLPEGEGIDTLLLVIVRINAVIFAFVIYVIREPRALPIARSMLLLGPPMLAYNAT